MSNHPHSILKNIPEGVNEILSKISSSPEIFTEAVPPFQEAQNISGYNYKLEYKPQAHKPKQKRKPKMDVLWFNPPYNLNVKTNVGKEFFKLVDQCFPRGNPLQKIANRQTIKISYSTTPNMNKMIAGANSKVLSTEETQNKLCNCSQDSLCPMGGKCLEN